MSNESNDQTLERVKDEIRAQAQALPQRPLLARQAPPARPGSPATPAIERNRLDYPIGELTDRHHLAFVDHAFRAILKRAPEPTEADRQIRLLAAGGSKAEVLGNLRWSPEGRRIGTRIGGLRPRYAMAKAGRVPVLGYLLQWATALAGLPLLVRHQRASDALFAAGDHAAVVAAHTLAARVDALADESALLRQRTDALQALAQELGHAQKAHALALAEIGAALRSRIEAFEGVIANCNGRLDEMDFLRQRVYAMNHWSHQLTQAFTQIETVATERQDDLGGRAARLALGVVARDATRVARNRTWADAFGSALPAQARVLALASGGDWLAELAARGLHVSGADANPTLAEAARARGVEIEPVPPQEILRRCADASLDGLSILSLPTLLRGSPAPELFAQAHRVLRGGGALLLACAREPDALVDALLTRGVVAPDPELLAHALSASGFATCTRIDAADGTMAWLACAAASTTPPRAC